MSDDTTTDEPTDETQDVALEVVDAGTAIDRIREEYEPNLFGAVQFYRDLDAFLTECDRCPDVPASWRNPTVQDDLLNPDIDAEARAASDNRSIAPEHIETVRRFVWSEWVRDTHEAVVGDGDGSAAA